jgi:protease-4
MTPTRLETVVVDKSPRWFERNRVAMIDVDGFIGSEHAAWMAFGGTSAADVKEKLMLAAEDDRVKAVVLRINSPGGEASASDMIYEEVVRFKEDTHKPVVAMLMGTAASGGYYIACSADYIVCAPTAVVGSVGVIVEFLNVEGLFGKIGLRTEVIKSGEMKDIGSPTRALTAKERELLQGLNRELFNQFVKAVREGRPKMTDDQIAAISDGRVVPPQDAVKLNLVDEVGYPDDAIDEARSRAGIESADVILYRPFPNYNNNVYARSDVGALLQSGMEFFLRQRGPTFLYLWSPGN